MAEIFVFGRVMQDIVPKQSQKNSTYTCFFLKEQIVRKQSLLYQVWAWNEDVKRLLLKKVHKDSYIWLTGTLDLVDSTIDHGAKKTMLLKVCLTNWGFVPVPNRQVDAEQSKESEIPVMPASIEVLDGDRESLPE